LVSKYTNLFRKHLLVESILTDEELAEKEYAEHSFYNFVERAWKHIEGKDFISGWHVRAMTEHLEALHKLEIRNLIINLPPRCGKSLITGVCYPAYLWIKDPSLRFLYSSYAQTLSAKDSVACRRLILSPWYQKLWGSKFSLMRDVNNKLRFDNNHNGYRIASSVGGSNTGLGGDLIISDDANSVTDVESEVTRVAVNDWWDYVMTTRFCNFKTGRRLVIQQRTHSHDLSGHILNKDDDNWVHLRLPMEFEKSNRCITIPLPSSGVHKWRDPRLKDKELLWEAGIGKKELDDIKAGFKHDSYRISGQLQQRPAPAGGGILQRDWFQVWKEKDLPELEFVLQSWDTALTSNVNSCFSACTTWGVFEDKGGIKNIILLSVFREKVEYPDLRKMAVRLAANYDDVYIDDPIIGRNAPDMILIEGKVNGYSLHQDLMAANLPVMLFNPNRHGDKIGRTRLISHIIENGLVWLPTIQPKCEFLTEDAEILLEAAEFFPKGDSADVIDSMSQALISLKQSGWVYNKQDMLPQKTEVWKQQKPYY
jgi:phage terminase large subunit-like protein